MKKLNKLNYIIPFAAVIALVFIFSAFESKESEHQVLQIADKDHTNKAAELVQSRKNGQNFKIVELFSKSNKNNRALNNAVSEGSLLSVSKSAINNILSTRADNITVTLPYTNGAELKLELVRVDIVPENFTINTSSQGSIKYKGGVYYQGMVAGEETSIATLSVFDNEVIGIIATDNGTYNLGAITDDNFRNTEDYILYKDANLMKENSFNCKVPDSYSNFYRPGNNHVVPTGIRSGTTSPVRMFYVCDFQMYQDRGSNTQSVLNYVTAIFNQVRVLYQNESLGLALASTAFVYTSTDPYTQFTTSQTEQTLLQFGTNTQNNFDGDLAQLLSTRTPITGAIAWVNVLCQSYEPGSQSGRYAYCQIENDYQNVPIYSWTIEVMAHETGHNFGSMHTHSCVWPTISGQIDSCYTSEGGCVTVERPNPNGTIMSYCHIPQGGGINFTRGFGPLPGDTIRLRYSQALCVDSALNSSENPLAFKLLQNYPNPFNPTTNIEFALPNDGFVTLRIYDVTGREVANLINNQFYNVGIFSYNLDASVYNLASGLYFYKLDVTRENNSVYSEIKKMVLVK